MYYIYKARSRLPRETRTRLTRTAQGCREAASRWHNALHALLILATIAVCASSAPPPPCLKTHLLKCSDVSNSRLHLLASSSPKSGFHHIETPHPPSLALPSRPLATQPSSSKKSADCLSFVQRSMTLVTCPIPLHKTCRRVSSHLYQGSVKALLRLRGIPLHNTCTRVSSHLQSL